MDIEGKRVLVTGATGGLGRAMATRLAGLGAEVIAAGRDTDRLEALVSTLPGRGHRVAEADLGQADGPDRLVAQVDWVDCLIANAALPATGRLTDLTEVQVSRMLRINLESPIHLSQAFLPGMIERGEGKIVMIGSLAGKAGNPRSSIYNATKFGLRGFAFGLRADLVGSGVGVTVVAPGFVRDAGMFAESGARLPRGLGTTTSERVADAVVEAIRRDRAEIAVAPPLQRTIAHIGLVSPTLSHRVQSSRTGQRTAEGVASRQTDKR